MNDDSKLDDSEPVQPVQGAEPPADRDFLARALATSIRWLNAGNDGLHRGLRARQAGEFWQARVPAVDTRANRGEGPNPAVSTAELAEVVRLPTPQLGESTGEPDTPGNPMSDREVISSYSPYTQ